MNQTDQKMPQKPILEKIAYAKEHSFAVREDILPYIRIPLHFHPEYELTYIIESHGKRFIGDNIENFEGGDLIFIGSNLPHFWRNEKSFYENKKEQKVRLLVVHFPEDFLGEHFFDAPELFQIRKFMHTSARGLKITGKTAGEIKEQMMRLLQERGFSRLMTLFSILDRLSRSNEIQYLATEGYKRGIEQPDADRINEVYEYIVDHFDENICLEDVSSLVNMSSSAFCRYLRSRLGKSFKQMLNEIRIGHACRELLETEKSITQIAYESGYNNISNFNRRFRELKNLNPLEFRTMYKIHTK